MLTKPDRRELVFRRELRRRGLKWCPKCKQIKIGNSLWGDFGVLNGNWDGMQTYCRGCRENAKRESA